MPKPQATGDMSGPIYFFNYARESERRGEQDETTSVPRQVIELGELASRKGGTVLATVVEDKPIPASEYSILERPGYAKLLQTMATMTAQIRSREPSARFFLAARSDSRISRRPMEREELLALCAKLDVWMNYGGAEYNPRNPDHKLTLRVTGAVAAHAADTISKNVLTGVRARIREGRPHGRMPRIYKQEFDTTTGKPLRWVLKKAEAKAAKEAIDSILEGRSGRGGHSMEAAVNYYNTQTGEQWSRSGFREMITNPVLAGIRVTHGEEVEQRLITPALLTEEEHRRLVNIIINPDRNTSPTRGTDLKYLGAYAMNCGGCGAVNRMATQWAHGTARHRRYTCRECFRVSIMAEPTDELLKEAILKLLTDPRVISTLNTPDGEDEPPEWTELRELQEELDEYYTLSDLPKGHPDKVSPRAVAHKESVLLPKIEALKEMMKPTAASPLLQQYAGPKAAEEWEGWPVGVRRALVRAGLIVTILPVGRGKWRGENALKNRVDFEWRV